MAHFGARPLKKVLDVAAFSCPAGEQLWSEWPDAVRRQTTSGAVERSRRRFWRKSAGGGEALASLRVVNLAGAAAWLGLMAGGAVAFAIRRRRMAIRLMRSRDQELEDIRLDVQTLRALIDAALDRGSAAATSSSRPARTSSTKSAGGSSNSKAANRVTPDPAADRSRVTTQPF